MGRWELLGSGGGVGWLWLHGAWSRRQSPCLSVKDLWWSDHPMWSGRAVELRGRLGTPGAEHMATGRGTEAGPQSWGPVEEARRERKETERDMKEVPRGSLVKGKISCQLRASREPGPHPQLGTRCPAAVPGGRGHREPPCSSASAQQCGDLEMLGGLIWSLTSCSKQGKEASSRGGAPAAPRPGSPH